jgi:hypothetical protein
MRWTWLVRLAIVVHIGASVLAVGLMRLRRRLPKKLQRAVTVRVPTGGKRSIVITMGG